jgi:hypothetical protein
MSEKYLTRSSPPQLLAAYKMEGLTDLEHWSSPDGCHENCPACEAEKEFNPHEALKLDVGAECNRLLELADALESTSGKNAVRLIQGVHETNVQHSYPTARPADIRSLVARVALFEELEIE